jgi:uncharacterized protein YcgI (DUF1989 family)
MKDLIKASQQYAIEPRTGVAFTVSKGEVIRVIDVEGEQVADLVCFARPDTEEYLSLCPLQPGNVSADLQYSRTASKLPG